MAFNNKNNKNFYIVDRTLVLKENLPIFELENVILNYLITSVKLTNLRSDKYPYKFSFFPDCVIELEINHRYKHQLNSVNRNIKKLIINGYQHNIKCFPTRLEKVLIKNYNLKITNLLPETLTHVEGIYNFTTFLPNLNFLSIIDNTILPQLSSNLEYLDIGNNYNYPLNLPNNLKVLVIGNNYNHPLKLPENLVTLEFKEDSIFNSPLELPLKLKVLYLGNFYNQKLYLPNEFEYLSIGKNFCQDIYNLTPEVFINWSRKFL